MQRQFVAAEVEGRAREGSPRVGAPECVAQAEPDAHAAATRNGAHERGDGRVEPRTPRRRLAQEARHSAMRDAGHLLFLWRVVGCSEPLFWLRNISQIELLVFWKMNPAGTWLAVQLARRRATGATTMAMHRLRALAAHLVARPEPAAAAAADATPNSPRGTAEQGFGIGWADRAPSDHVQPPVFDPSTELREACEFYAENGFVVVDALSAEECAEMNATADRFLEDTGDAALQEQSGGQGQLFYPLLGSAEDIDRYSAVDKYITHPRTLPVIADVLGGAPAVSAPHPPPPHHDHHDHPPPPQKE